MLKCKPKPANIDGSSKKPVKVSRISKTAISGDDNETKVKSVNKGRITRPRSKLLTAHYREQTSKPDENSVKTSLPANSEIKSVAPYSVSSLSQVYSHCEALYFEGEKN